MIGLKVCGPGINFLKWQENLSNISLTWRLMNYTYGKYIIMGKACQKGE